MKKNSSNSLSLITALIFAASRLVVSAAPGDLDPTFGGTGKVTTDFNGNNNYAQSMALQTDGKIVVVGYTNASPQDFAVIRYNPDGNLDTSFGIGGRVTTDLVGYDDRAYGVAIQSDGKIVVTGESFNGSDDDFAVVRYNTNGSLDNGFGGDGKVTTPIGNDHDDSHAIAVQTDGKIVVTGRSRNAGSNWEIATVRYDTSGNLDPSFNGTGKAITPIPGDEIAYDLAIQSDGKIVLAGEASGGNYSFVVARYDADGTPDASFGTGGKVTTLVGTSASFGRSVALQDGGKIIVAGYSNDGLGHAFFAVARYNPNGSLDEGFGSDGKLTTFIRSSIDVAGGYGVAVQSDGKIVVAGDSTNGSYRDFAVVRYETNGNLDGTFGLSGKVITSFGFDAVGSGVVVQSDGKLVVAGSASGESNYDFAVVRYLAATAPVAATAAALNVTGVNATLQGSVNPSGAATTAYFEYGATALYGSTTPVQNLGAGTNAVDVMAAINGLTPGATYHYRIVASNAGGTVFGLDLSFQATPSGGENPTAVPSVTTGSFSGVTSSGVTIAGTVNPNGGTTLAQVEYGLTTSYGSVSLEQNVGNGTLVANVALPVSGLLPLTTYHYRVIASNSLGSGHGDDGTFTTDGIPPEVHTLAATGIASTSATFNAQVTAHTGATSVIFLYGLSASVLDKVAAAPSSVTGNSPPQPVSVTLPKGTLANGTMYFYRALALSGAGSTSATEVMSFTTQNALPVVNAGVVLFANDTITIPVGSLASDPDGEALTVVGDPTGAQYGTATTSTSGKFITYKPNSFFANAPNAETLGFTVSDGAQQATGSVTIYPFNAFKGSYVGSIKTTDGGIAGTGRLELAVTGTGAVTYALIWQGQKYSGKATIQRDGSLFLSEEKIDGGGVNLELTLTLQPDPNAQLLDGSLADGSTEPPTVARAQLVGTATADDIEDALPAAGIFTAYIDTNGLTLSPSESVPEAIAPPLPRGVGFSQITVTKARGRPARFVGRMPDAQPYSSGVKALAKALRDAASGRPTYQLYDDRLYGRSNLGPRGIVNGQVDFDRFNNRFDSALNWERGANVGTRFPAGFRTGLAGLRAQLTAVRYGRPAPGSLPVSIQNSNDFTFNARIEFRDGNLASPLVRKLKLRRSGSGPITTTVVTLPGENANTPPRKLKVRINAALGFFGGTFIHPEDASLAKPSLTDFHGVFQKFDGQGVFGTKSNSGLVLITHEEPN